MDDEKARKLLAAINASIRQMNRFVAELEKLHQPPIQTGTGVPGQRDPGAPCVEFRPGNPRDGDCEGDGHYLCDQCAEHSTRLTAEAVDSGSKDSAPVDGDGERS